MFSENLVRLRKINQMTQEDIAEAVGVSRQAVAKWESGVSQSYRYNTAIHA
jgi:transcriptional regulator with XRE-family HTH domain